jgi:protein-disulfide isomerase
MAQPAPSLSRFYLILAVLAVVGIGVLAWQMTRPTSPVVPVAVTVQPGDTAGFEGYVLGAADAPVEIVEFADYQCHVCQTFASMEFPYVKERLIQTGRVRWVYRDFPLEFRWSRLAMHAAACAEEQGRFWEMNEAIYSTFGDWTVSRDAGAVFRRLVRDLGMDVSAYDACMNSLRHAGRIQAMGEAGGRLGVHSTPTFMIGGQLFPGLLRYEQLRRMVDSLSPVP